MTETKTKPHRMRSIGAVGTVNFRADSEEFVPTSDGFGGFQLKVSGLVDYTGLPPRMAGLLDAGVDLEMPKNLRVVVEISPEWAKKGMVITSVPMVGQTRLTVMCYNVGKQILAFEYGDNIGRYYFVESVEVAVRPLE